MPTQASFRTQCPHYGKGLSAPAKLEGKTVPCPNPACGKMVALPGLAKNLPVQAASSQEVSVAPPPTDIAVQIADQLENLRQLYVSGSLSHEEYATAKKSLLNAPGKEKKSGKAKRAKTEQADSIQQFAKNSVYEMFEPLTVYFQMANNPEDIASDEGNWANLYKFMGASIALTAAVESVLPGEGSLIKALPWDWANNLLTMLLWVLIGLLNAAVIYHPLRWQGGTGCFRATMIAGLYVTTLSYPILSVMDSLVRLLLHRPMPSEAIGAVIGVLAPILARIHNLSQSRTIVAVLGGSLAASVPLYFLMMASGLTLGSNNPQIVEKAPGQGMPGKVEGNIEATIRDGILKSTGLVVKSLELTKHDRRGYTGTATAENGHMFKIVVAADGRWEANPWVRETDQQALEASIRHGMRSKGLDNLVFDLKKEGNGGYAGTATARNGQVYDLKVEPDGRWEANLNQPCLELRLRHWMKTKGWDLVSLDLRSQGNGGFDGTATLQNGQVYDLTVRPDGTWHLTPGPAEKAKVAERDPAGILPTGKWINLLAMVKLPEHVVAGTWERQGDAVICHPLPDARIILPVVIMGSYELELAFTRTVGKENIAPIFTAGKHQCLMHLGGWGGTTHGLDVVKGVVIDQRDSPAVTRPGHLQNGRRYLCRIQVQQADNMSHVKVEFDQRTIVDWRGRDSDLSLRSMDYLINRRCLGISVFASAVTIHSVRLHLSPNTAAYPLGENWKHP